MTDKEFRVALAILDMSCAELARQLKVSGATPTYWHNGKVPVPYYAEFFVKSLLKERGEMDAAELTATR